MNRKEQQITNKIKNSVLKKNPEAEIVLFGSHARGQAAQNSDWDILILLNTPEVTRTLEREYREVIFDIELEVGEPISTFVFSKTEWEQKHSVTPLYKNIKQDGILLS